MAWHSTFTCNLSHTYKSFIIIFNMILFYLACYPNIHDHFFTIYVHFIEKFVKTSTKYDTILYESLILGIKFRVKIMCVSPKSIYLHNEHQLNVVKTITFQYLSVNCTFWFSPCEPNRTTAPEFGKRTKAALQTWFQHCMMYIWYISLGYMFADNI